MRAVVLRYDTMSPAPGADEWYLVTAVAYADKVGNTVHQENVDVTILGSDGAPAVRSKVVSAVYQRAQERNYLPLDSVLLAAVDRG